MEEGEGGTDESDEELRLENPSVCKTKQWEKNAEQKVAKKEEAKDESEKLLPCKRSERRNKMILLT